MPSNMPPLLHGCSFCVLVLLIAAPWAAAEDTGQKLAEYLQACVEVEDFSGSVLVACNGQTLLAKGFGLANREHGVANTPHTKFRLGSITKQFTAAAVLLLEEQGKLKLDDPVSRHCEEAPPAWEGITIHHLLSHTAGLPNFTSFPEYRQKWMLPSPPAETMRRFLDKPLEFEPGQQFRYSNSGYIVLGVIIERASGQSYGEFVRQAIFQPLGMKDSGYDTHDAILSNRAAGYHRSGEAPVNAPYLDMTQPHAAGALYSTVEDLHRWDQALTAGKLLSQDSLQKMFAPVKDNYAYGWQMSRRSGRQQQAHGGGINGFATYILRVPDEKLLVVVLSNVVPSPPGRMAGELAAIVLGEPYTAPQARQVARIDPKLYDAYAGRYQLLPAFTFTISRDADRLMVQGTDQSKIEFFPESETKFFSRTIGAEITFVKGDDGEVTHLVLHQGARDQEAKRLPEGEAPSETKP
jgi:CubicO group peptidase (beta-lactamase class C family)